MAAVAETYTRNADKDINNVANILSLPQVLLDEDGDSRDSGISIGSCADVNVDDVVEKSALKMGEVTTTTHRQALVDCSNSMAKNLVNSSSNNASIFLSDTPTSRKAKSVFASQPVVRSVYEKEELHQQVSNKNHARYLNMDECTQLTRKRNSSSSSCTAVQKRSRSLKIVGENEEGEDEVFFNFEPPQTMPLKPLPASVSLLDVSTAYSHRNVVSNTRKTSDDSSSVSGSSANAVTSGPIKTHRAMSVGFIEPDAPLPETLEVRYTLPAVEWPQKESQAYRSISPTTLLSEYRRLGDDFHSIYVVVDCRYPYEFEGGHLKGACNIFEVPKIGDFFFSADPLGETRKRIPIFYCEYSQKRGPTMANKLRSIDRVRNQLKYPHVEYPEIYLLDHGYKALWKFEECQEICEPRGYVPMDTPEYLHILRSFRGARHRSNASSVKSTSDLTGVGKIGGSLRKNSHRTLRKNMSSFSVHSKLTSSLSSDSILDLSLSVDDPFANCDPFESNMGRRSVSNFEIGSVSSEVDIDAFLEEDKIVQAITEQNQVVRVAMKVESPEFNIEFVPKTPVETEFKEPKLATEKGTPRACLDFSSISDTD